MNKRHRPSASRIALGPPLRKGEDSLLGLGHALAWMVPPFSKEGLQGGFALSVGATLEATP